MLPGSLPDFYPGYYPVHYPIIYPGCYLSYFPIHYPGYYPVHYPNSARYGNRHPEGPVSTNPVILDHTIYPNPLHPTPSTTHPTPYTYSVHLKP